MVGVVGSNLKMVKFLMQNLWMLHDVVVVWPVQQSCVPYTSYFLVELNIFPELSRTSGLFPGPSSPGKCHNKIPGLSRFSRTRTNPADTRQRKMY